MRARETTASPGRLARARFMMEPRGQASPGRDVDPMNPMVRDKPDDIVKLCRRFRVSSLELFGSAAGERFDEETSDFDFLVEYEATSPKEHADCYFGLLFALHDLLGRDVDLVELFAIHNPYFLKAIASERVLLS